MLYAIVDIETTGSYAAGSGITEIAIITHDGQQALHTWQTLINPQRQIPRFIQQLTGITNELVEGAPVFEEVAATIHELLQDKIFVAHNVNFDYSFVKHHLQRCGLEIGTRKLCTVRLARKIVPGFASYSLGRLCHSLEIAHNDHHRAFGDAQATALLFAHLIANDAGGAIAAMLKGRNGEQYLPPHLSVEEVSSLPECPGVYYFYNKEGKVIYVGKAINLHKRVKSHFANNKPGRQKQDFLRDIYRIAYQAVGTDLMAHIFESVEIRRLWPIHNRSQRGFHPKFGIYAYEDRQGFKRLALDANRANSKPLHTFNSEYEGHTWLRRLISEFELCARLCNIAKGADCDAGVYAEGCTGQCRDVEDYNSRVDDATAWIEKALPTLAILDAGRTEDEQSCLLVLKGVFYGMGYLSYDGCDVHDLPSLKKCLEPLPDNDYIRSLIYRHASEFPDKCVRWEDGAVVTNGRRVEDIEDATA